MKNIISLVSFFISINLKQTFDKDKVSKFIKYVSTFLIISIFLILAVRNEYAVLLKGNNEKLIVPFFFNILSIICFVYSIFLVISTICMANDNEFLLKFPVKINEILISKIIFIYVSLLPIAVFIIPGMFTYLILSKADIIKYIYSIFSMFIIPVLPVLYSSIISITISSLTVKIKNRTMIKNIINLLILLLIAAVGFVLINSIMSPQSISSYLDSNTDNEINVFTVIFYMNVLLSRLFFSGYEGVKYIFIMMLFTALILMFILLICRKLYEKILFPMFDSSGSIKKDNHRINNKADSILISLIKRDLLILFRNSQLFLYSFGFIFLAILAIGSCIPILYSIGILNTIKNNSSALLMVLIVFSLGISGFNYAASSSLSREAKYIDILKIFPFSAAVLFHAKLLTALIVGSITLILDFILILICSKTLTVGVIAFVMSILVIVFNAVMGIYSDISNPNFNWINEKDMIQNDLLKLLKPAIYTNLSTFIFIILFVIFRNIGTESKFIIISLVFFTLFLIFIGIYYRKALKKYNEFFDE